MQTNRSMSEKEKKQLLKAQQGELDAVLLYQKMASCIRETQFQETFLKVAADEGKHAGILRGYTGIVLKPKATKANVMKIIYPILGLRTLLNIFSKGEFNAAKTYQPLLEKFPEIQKILSDEDKHGNIMKDMAKQWTGK